MATTVDLSKYKRILHFFWDPEPANDAAASSSIWCLGKEYQAELSKIHELAPKDDTTEATRSNYLSWVTHSNDMSSHHETKRSDVGTGWPADFLEDFHARFWFTYRSNFPLIQKSQDSRALALMSLKVRIKSQLVDQAGFTSDTGWGCMIRSGQCLLANALAILRLGRDWRRGSVAAQEREILALFSDDPRAPFSIHKFVEHGAAACGKHPGEWFGPSATAHCIQSLTNEYEPSGIKVYINKDGPGIYEETYRQIAMAGSSETKPTLILVGTRLGLDKITPLYWEALKATLQLSQSIGIAGGRPSSSHYFIGTQGPYFFYLDPHHTRTALPFPSTPDLLSDLDVDTCHTQRLRRIHIEEMDPSMLIGFLIRDEDDWRRWRKAVQEVGGKPIIHIEDRDPAIHGAVGERKEAIDEVESFDDDEEGMK